MNPREPARGGDRRGVSAEACGASGTSSASGVIFKAERIERFLWMTCCRPVGLLACWPVGLIA